jgi:hypothetical protein
MLLIKTNTTFIKKNKKTKYGKKTCKRKYINSLYVNDIHICTVTKILITKRYINCPTLFLIWMAIGFKLQTYEFLWIKLKKTDITMSVLYN